MLRLLRRLGICSPRARVGEGRDLLQGIQRIPGQVGSGKALLALAERHRVSWHKLRGHSGNRLNERADRLARAAIERLQRQVV